MIPALLRNVAAGARLALFLRLRPFDFRVSALDFALLVLFNIIVWLLVSGARVGFEGEIDLWALIVYLAAIPLVLAAAMVVALVYGAPARLLAVATALTAPEWLFHLATLGLPALFSLTGAPLGSIVFFAWIWAAALRAVAVSAGTQRPQLYQGALAVSVMMALTLFVFPETDAWRSPEAEEGAAPLAAERLFHRQGELIERTLAGIEPGRGGVREHYFVGFAPDASQEVFLRELRYVKRVFDQRFGTAGRSVALASSQHGLEELPIASVTNLARVLGRVGASMNPDEDVLVLFVSAHGTPEQRLSAWQPPLELTPLTPTALARMLQDAGIKWRVIVISACYSGGFIEPLRDDNSIVITASAPDRASFGCEGDREFTYFGQAYFREALAKTASFTEAFQIARELVTRQEAAEGLPASLPQMSAGSAIDALLKAR